MKGLQLFVGVILLLTQAACQSNSHSIIETPKKTKDGIATATLAEVNMNSKVISDQIMLKKIYSSF
jgi:hypothetical protein